MVTHYAAPIKGLQSPPRAWPNAHAQTSLFDGRKKNHKTNSGTEPRTGDYRDKGDPAGLICPEASRCGHLSPRA